VPAHSQSNDSLSLRISELRETLFRLNDAMQQRMRYLEHLESLVVEKLASGNLSLNVKAVEAYKLADRILAKSMRLNIRIYQRNILYFTLRRRQLLDKLAAFGVSAEELDREWRAKASGPIADDLPSSPSEPPVEPQATAALT
jgi:hypothetical protein